MSFIYANDNIPEAIVKALLENKRAKKIEDRLHQGYIRRRIGHILGHNIGDKQLRKNLITMKDQKLLNEFDTGEGKRGYKVYYSPTAKAEKMYLLKILGASTEIQKRKNLYQLLIFFEIYKRGVLLSKRQLTGFLRNVGSSINKLERLEDDMLSIPNLINFKPVNGIEITAIIQYQQKIKLSRTSYYVVSPGFSIEEFVIYLKLLNSGIEPKPFTPYPAIFQIPFVSNTSFTEKEVLSAVEALNNYGLIESDTSIPSEKRFRIKDENLRHLIYSVWLVQILDVHLLHLRLIHKRPSMRDKEYLKSYMNEEVATKLRNLAYDIRHNKQAPEDLKKSISLIENNRAYIIREIQEKYNDIIKKDEVISELIEEICFSPFFSKFN